MHAVCRFISKLAITYLNYIHVSCNNCSRMRMLSRSSFFRRMVRLRPMPRPRMNVVLDFLDIWFADKKSLHSSSLRCCCFSQNTHVSHDQCGRFPNHSTTGRVKYHVTDNFAVFLATEFTLQNSRVFGRLHSRYFVCVFVSTLKIPQRKISRV